MSDLTGVDAFEHVVAQLINQVTDRARDNDKRRDAESERNDAIRKLASVEAELGSTKTSLTNYRSADDAFIDLYDEIEKVAKALAESNLSPEMATSLRAKMTACKKFIDPIPF